MSASAGPAAQFSATVNKIQVNLACSGTACTDNQIDEVVSTIKVPNRKELLVGVSAQVGITTQTTVKGKLGGGGAATSTGGVKVGVELCPRANFNAATKACSAGVIYGEPGTITLNARSQELSAILGGVITSCTVGDDGVIDGDRNDTGDTANEADASLVVGRASSPFRSRARRTTPTAWCSSCRSSRTHAFA